MLEIEFLGTGTSTGVPQIRCKCPVCQSADARDKRLRASAIVRYQGKRLLIDCGPDFRTQMLRASDNAIDALLITHFHYDHIGGIDDLRAYCSNDHKFPVYAKGDVVDDLHKRMPYCFAEHLYPGVPTFEIHEIDDRQFIAEGVTVTPIPVMHYKLPIYGYRIGPLAYITDCKTIADDQVAALHGIPLLVINALRIQPHLSHLSLSEAIGVARRISPQRTIFIHASHDMGLHAVVNHQLPDGFELAYDGQIVMVDG